MITMFDMALGEFDVVCVKPQDSKSHQVVREERATQYVTLRLMTIDEALAVEARGG